MKRGFADAGGGGGEKGKMPEPAAEEEVDELLAALGYKVRASDMADVAQKLEQLEMAMNAATSTFDDAGLANHLAVDTVHYNPSDLSSWLETMLSEVNTPPALPPSSSSSLFAGVSSLAAPLPAAPPHPPGSRETKRAKGDLSSSPSSSSSVTSPRLAAAANAMSGTTTTTTTVVMVDAQEAGIRLVHALMACAEAIATNNIPAADALVKQISVLAASQLGAMRKVAAYFAEALARRIYRFRPSPDSALLDTAFADMLHLHFFECCPYLKFAHFTANQAINEAFAGYKRVHIVDFGIKQGMQWPPLLQALALRPGGPPEVRITGIGPPQADQPDVLEQVGYKLKQFAETLRIDFRFQALVANSLADIEPLMLQSASPSTSGEPEAVAVNSVLELHRLLGHPGALEKTLATVRAVQPRIVTVVEQEANHNAGSFLERFTEALHYYSSMFDSLEGTTSGSLNDDSTGGGGLSPASNSAMSEIYLGRQILNVVACDGADRTERHETLSQWRTRLARSGFEPVHLGSNAYKEASTLLAFFAGGDGYRVEERDGCLTLGWHTRPLIATSAWRCVAA